MTEPRDRLQHGIALHRSGDFAGAAREYRGVLAEEPGNADALHLLGLLAYRRGELGEADALIERALASDARNPVFLANLGNVRKDAGDPGGAALAYRAALAVDPRQLGARNNLGTLLLAQGAIDEAIPCFEAVVAAAPDHARAWFNLGSALARRGNVAAAADAHRRAVSAEPSFAQAWAELGLALQVLGRAEAAAEALRTRCQLEPGSATAAADLALVLHRAGDLRSARQHYERAVALDPDALEVRCNLCALLQRMCDWSAVDAQWRVIRASIEQGRAGVPAGLLVAQPGATPALQLAAALANAGARRLSGATAPRRPDPAHRIRLGYLSADFREHATAYLTTELFELHDRARYEVVLLSHGPDDRSAARARLERASDQFVDLRDCDDDTAAARIAALGVDVLIDLNGDTDNGRIGIAARRPAAISVSWLGFPGTLGRDLYDYIVADPHLVPEGDERWYAERVVRLPECYQCNDRHRPRPVGPVSRADYGLPEDAVVLCCFNQAFKITGEVFARWLAILHACPRAVLWLLEDNPEAAAALAGEVRRAGLAPGRLVFAPRMALAEHLARYRAADLALDTFPCTSHTTASDALWMGCPLVTVTGETFASRVATSLLRNVGLAKLALSDLDAYERRIRDLVEAPNERAAWRATLEQAPRGSPLFDTPRFVRSFERVLEVMIAGGPG